MPGVRLSVAQLLPAEPERAVTADGIAGQTGLTVREVLASLNRLQADGAARRLVPGDGKHHTAIARWIRSEVAG